MCRNKHNPALSKRPQESSHNYDYPYLVGCYEKGQACTLVFVPYNTNNSYLFFCTPLYVVPCIGTTESC